MLDGDFMSYVLLILVLDDECEMTRGHACNDKVE